MEKISFNPYKTDSLIRQSLLTMIRWPKSEVSNGICWYGGIQKAVAFPKGHFQYSPSNPRVHQRRRSEVS